MSVEKVRCIAFRRVADEGGWLSNMSPHPVEFEGVRAKTAEHLFQARRLGLGTRAAERVLSAPSPMASKLAYRLEVRRGARLVIQPRSPEDIQSMIDVLRGKLTTNLDLVQRLRDTGEAVLVEDTSARPRPDLFWGASRVPPDDKPSRRDMDELVRRWSVDTPDQGLVCWTGDNHLGYLWMGLRRVMAMLRNEHALLERRLLL